ncbi:MAG TPA: hypothetical protein VEU30_11845, partial [Thermoanaerobaculia bacterium]|nr:hypothetical protein [Thermoanaerobaculia bacterium]
AGRDQAAVSARESGGTRVTKRINLGALPTKSWRSHAFFRAGIAAATRGDHASAEALYIEALRDDPNNLAARVNFAGELMVARDDDPSNDRFALEFAVEQLEAVLRKLQQLKERKDAQSKLSDDAIYFAALYRLASAHYDLGNRVRAVYYAQRLDREIREATETSGEQHDDPEDPLQRRMNERLRAFVEQSYPAAKVMLIGMKLEYRDPAVSLADLRQAGDVPVPTAQFQYNFACALAIYVALEPDGETRGKLEAEAVQRLRLAIRMKEDLRARARVDCSLASLRTNKDFLKLTTAPAATVPAA